MGLVPKRTKTEIKVLKNMSKTRFFGLLASLMFGAMVGKVFVHRYLYIVFIVFCVLVYLILTAKSASNPNKTFWKGLLDFLRFNRSVKRFYGNNTQEFKEAEEYRNEIKQKTKEKCNKSDKLFFKRN